ncbi:MAG: YIP1 family protein [Melioribacteraceae bacterium]|nr:YIP1 family protein [Melioribacteraceae bacterium]
MEDLDDNKLNDEELLEEEEFEFNHSDKLVGLFSEPANTFTKIAQAQTKVIDWLIPLLIFIVVISLSTIIMQSNPQIKFQMIEKQTEAMEKSFSEYVNSGAMTQEQADTQIEAIRERMEGSGIEMLIPQIVGIVIFSFIVFFIMSGFYYGVIRLILKGDGTFSNAMVGYGLPFYIASVQSILVVIVAMLMNKMATDLSVATFLDLDKTEFVGFLLSKLDLFSIWFYVVVGIALAKMFKSEETTKYVGMVIGLWLGFSLLFFYLGNAFPLLSFLNQ